MHSKVTTKCDNSSRTKYETGVLGGDSIKHDEKVIINAQKIV